jgi:putative glycosyltransferase
VQLSIVSTLYRSEPHLREFCSLVTAAAGALTADFEVILVNDGSPDRSLALALELQRQESRIVVIDLSRNFGHHRAMMTGLAHARGDRVFLIDSDLEEDPALLGRFSATLETSGADVVYGFQEQRQGDAIRRWTGRAYYALFNALSDTQLPENLCTIRLMTRRYVQSLLQHQERITNIAGLWALTGYDQVGVPITRRLRSDSAYTIAQRLTTLVDGVTAFSHRPLVLIFYLGLAISTLAAIAAGYLIVRRLFFGVLLAGWPSVIVSIWLLGGIILFCVGLVGMYLSRIFVETKQRPYTIVRQVYGGGQGSSGSH